MREEGEEEEGHLLPGVPGAEEQGVAGGHVILAEHLARVLHRHQPHLPGPPFIHVYPHQRFYILLS